MPIDQRLGQGELARRAGIPQNTLSLIELGHRSPTVTTLEKIAQGLGIGPAELLEEPDVPLAQAARAPRITADDIERQARSRVGYGKLAFWRQRADRFISDRRAEQQNGVVTRKGSWVLPTEPGGKPTWQEAVTISLEDPAVRAA